MKTCEKKNRKSEIAIPKRLWPLLLAIGLRAQDALIKMGLEDLSQIEVAGRSVTLTTTSERAVPADVTVITHEQIRESGARSLDELLEIYVPSFYTLKKVHGTQMGIRGIISDRNNKILLLLNGRNMNVKATDGGAITERWISTLDDIYRITVVNGPGSAVFGPGAIAGVISIETFDGLDFEGTDVNLRGGVGERLVSAQIRHGGKLGRDWGLFLFLGVDRADGADGAKAPHKIAFDQIVQRPQYESETQFVANKRFPFETVPDGASYLREPRYAGHIQLDSENTSLWLRFTQTSQAVSTLQQFYFYQYAEHGADYTWIFKNTGNRQRQLTFLVRHTDRPSSHISIEYSASYMYSQLKNATLAEGLSGKSWSERDLLLNAVVRYQSFEGDAVAVGLSYDSTRFLGRDKLYTTQIAQSIGADALTYRPEWYSYLASAYGEYQGHVGGDVTVFAGLRMDKHRFSRWMFSPRLALVYLPDGRSTLKFIYNRSVRRSDDADLYSIYLRTGKDGDVERIDHFETLLSRKLEEDRRFDFSFFFDRHEVVAFVQDAMLQARIGTLRFWGLEAKYHHEGETWQFSLSHSYVKQLRFDLDEDGVRYQNISASPYGYGNDLANWPNHITKIEAEGEWSRRLKWHASLRIYWGLPGAVDLADYNMEVLNGLTLLPMHSDGKRAFATSAFFNAGIRYRWRKDVELSLYGYDLLGLLDEDLNKRNFFQRTSHYRDTAPTLIAGIRYRF